jgi:putative transposase
MSTKRYKPEQIINLLRQVEVEIANGKTTPQACRDAQITAQTYYRWKGGVGHATPDSMRLSRGTSGLGPRHRSRTLAAPIAF